MRRFLLVSALLGCGFVLGSTWSLAKTKEEFHGDVAHALLEMHEALDTIAEYHKAGGMPPNRDELHEKAAHGFKHALELWGFKPKMHE
jgi:hypothetical protein